MASPTATIVPAGPQAILVASAVFAAFLAAGAPLGAQSRQPQFEVVEVPALPGHPFSRTSRINSHGHAVGGNWTCPFILSCLGRAFLYDGEETLDFTASLLEGLPPGTIGITRGVDINDTGDVLFWLTIVDVGVFPYLWRDREEFAEIEGPPGAVGTTGLALNERGVVAGTYSTSGGESRGFLWTADEGVIEVIEPPLGFTSSGARGLNDAGEVAGGLSGGATADRAFFWSGGAITVLEPLPGDVRSLAIDVSNSGLVAGKSTDAAFSDSLVVWRDGSVVDAVTLGFESVLLEIHQISDAGVVIGSYWPTQESPQHFAFRWSEADGFEQIDTLDLSLPDLNLWQATGVNASGQIVAWGEYPGFLPGMFLLTPTAVTGDLDGDGSVSVDDLVLLIVAWGPCPGPPDDCPADLDGDGTVSVEDLIILITNWG